jgi:hypothetical protein
MPARTGTAIKARHQPNRSKQIVIIFGSEVWNQNPVHIFEHFLGTIPALQRL